MQAMAASPWGPMPPALGDLEAIAQESLDESLRDPALAGFDAVGLITNSGATCPLVQPPEGTGLVELCSRGLGRIGCAPQLGRATVGTTFSIPPLGILSI